MRTVLRGSGNYDSGFVGHGGDFLQAWEPAWDVVARFGWEYYSL